MYQSKIVPTFLLLQFFILFTTAFYFTNMIPDPVTPQPENPVKVTPASVDVETGAMERPFLFFFGGLSLGFEADLFALIPLCIFSDLKKNKRNRRYNLCGALPLIVLRKTSLELIVQIAFFIW